MSELEGAVHMAFIAKRVYINPKEMEFLKNLLDSYSTEPGRAKEHEDAYRSLERKLDFYGVWKQREDKND